MVIIFSYAKSKPLFLINADVKYNYNTGIVSNINTSCVQNVKATVDLVFDVCNIYLLLSEHVPTVVWTIRMMLQMYISKVTRY